MATKISELIAANTPLAGTEYVWVEQNGLPRKVAVSEIGGGITEIGGVDFYDTAGSGGGDFRVLHPDNSASLSIDAANQTGAIKITLPYGWTSSMLQMVVKGYNYNSTGGGAFLLNLGGYNYTNGYWNDTSAEAMGELTNPKVRFGHDGTNCCIVIGDVTDDWDYPKVWVEQLLVSYAGMNAGWHTGWNISMISSEAGITYTATHYANRREYEMEFDALKLTGDMDANNKNIGIVNSIRFANQEIGVMPLEDGTLFYDVNVTTADYPVSSTSRGGLQLYNQEDGWGLVLDTNNMEVVYSQFARVSTNQLRAASGDVITVGAGGLNQRMRMRHIDGKDSATDNKDTLYVNYGTEHGMALGGDLDIQGTSPTLFFTDSDDADGYIQHQSGSMQFWNNGTRTCYMNNGQLIMENGYWDSKVTGGKAASFDNGQAMITIHDGSGNFNIKAGLDEVGNVVTGTGANGSQLRMDDGGLVYLGVLSGAEGAAAVWDKYIIIDNTNIRNIGPSSLEGEVTIENGVVLSNESNNRLGITTSTGYLIAGPANSSYCHFYTDRSRYYFDHSVNVNGEFLVHGTNVKMDSGGFVSAGNAAAYRFGNGLGYIGDYSTGGVRINAGNGDYFLYGIQGGSLYLRYANATKLQTVSGGATTTGTHTATDFNSTSSERWKENIVPLHSALNPFMGLTPVTFDWRDDYEGWNRAQGKHSVGLVVEHVAQTIPMAAIKELDADGNWNGNYSGVDFGKIAPYHIAVTQDHEVRLRELERKLEAA